jgi:light-regulated signal transduction histidine kinase (bacteriophytochrome)
MVCFLGYYFVYIPYALVKKHYNGFCPKQAFTQQNERLEQFTYITTHDLQNPTIIGFSYRASQNECSENINEEYVY